MPTELDDLLSEGRRAQRETSIAKAAKKVQEKKDKTPEAGGPPIRRDIYQQLDWQALSITLVVVETTCDCCNRMHRNPNPILFIERYHRRHGRHYVEVSRFDRLPTTMLEELPRRVETRAITTPFCHECFLTENTLCLEKLQTPVLDLTQTSTASASTFNGIPSVPQVTATPLLPEAFPSIFQLIAGK